MAKLVVREDAHLLFGFYSKQEREMFNLLISVNGVGPASAMMMLSTLNLDEIAGAIGSGNSALLQKVKGIGMKSAQRIIIDLRDKMSIFVGSGEISLNQNNKIKNETLNALEVLGVPKKIAERHIDLLLKENPDSSVEELIKNILKKL
ncbi:unnamed protein product [Darwinula stevensoni]|uniref:Helix-hairpin-helix DNA-binding motif class 1 domain-containing protein n=1 Tax=Darwinula stevensoni TaxID=69355 RepID=A0A7R9AGL5_9CRUS|nr:unnamed protein product [Darwinula stevensoni]CAG0904474.1 unnamed protein product [Darwinula stevensoni]